MKHLSLFTFTVLELKLNLNLNLNLIRGGSNCNVVQLGSIVDCEEIAAIVGVDRSSAEEEMVFQLKTIHITEVFFGIFTIIVIGCVCSFKLPQVDETVFGCREEEATVAAGQQLTDPADVSCNLCDEIHFLA